MQKYIENLILDLYIPECKKDDLLQLKLNRSFHLKFPEIIITELTKIQ